MTSVTLQLTGLILSLLAGEALHQFHLTSIIPESAATLAVGLVLGVLVSTLSPAAVVEASHFSESLFTLALLPIIIFESGYSLYRDPFFAHLGPILVYALLGTLVSGAVTSAVISTLAGSPSSAAALGLPLLSPWECITLGSLLSATDPVATLAVFSSLRVEPVLNALVYGESVINDAVGIVMFRVASAFIFSPPTSASALEALGSVARILVGAVAWGVLVALAGTRVLNDINMRGLLGSRSRLKTLLSLAVSGVLRGGRSALFLRSKPAAGGAAAGGAAAAPQPARSPPSDTPQPDFLEHVILGCGETLYLLLFGYLSFVSAEALGLSGIVAALFAGITLAIYARPILSWPGKRVSTAVLRFLAGLADAAVFLQIGLGLVLLGRPGAPELALAATAFAGCLLGRAANIFPLSTAINVASGRMLVASSTQVQMWWAGLRGGIAFASAIAFPTAQAPLVARAVGLVCVATVVVMGPTTVPLLQRLRIPFGEEALRAQAAREAGSSSSSSSRQQAAPSYFAARADALIRWAVYSRETQRLLAEKGGAIDLEPILVLSPRKSPRGRGEGGEGGEAEGGEGAGER